jgi:hypothetical protein
VGGGIASSSAGKNEPSHVEDPTPQDDEELDSLEQTTAYWGATNPPPNIHVGMDESYKQTWIEAYSDDI